MMQATLHALSSRSRPPDARAEPALVEAARAGDRKAFGELVERYQTLMASLALSLTRDLVLSEELAQDIFLRAWRRLPKLREPSRFRAYLYTIARGLCSDSRRDRRRQNAIRSSAAAGSEVVSAEPSPLDRIITSEEKLVVWRALGNIPERYRLPLILYYREQESVERVAESLGINAETVRQRLLRGRRMLRDEILVASLLDRTRSRKVLAASIAAAIAGESARDASADSGRPSATARVGWSALAAGAALSSIVSVAVVGGAGPGAGTLVARSGAPIGEIPVASPGTRAPAPVAPPAFSGTASQRPPSVTGASTEIVFDFENGVLPAEFEQGHVVPAPPGSSSRFCLMGTIRPTWPQGSQVRIDKNDGAAIFPYSPTGVLSFDYWVGGDAFYTADDGTGLLNVAVDLRNLDKGLRYEAHFRNYETDRWQHVELPLSTFESAGPSSRPAESGDRIGSIAITGGRAAGQPFYVDNIRFAPH